MINTCHITIKIMPADVKSINMLILNLKKEIKILNSKLVIMLVYQNIKTSLPKITLQIGQKNSLWFRKLKTLNNGNMKKWERKIWHHHRGWEKEIFTLWEAFFRKHRHQLLLKYFLHDVFSFYQTLLVQSN